MNTIDMIILVVVGIFCVKGFSRGIILEVFTLIGLLIAYIIALREMDVIAGFINQLVSLPLIVVNSLGFVLLFVSILFLFRWVAGMLRRIAQWSFMGWLDRGGGMILGIFKGTLITSLFALFVSLIPLSEGIERMEEQSLLFQPVRSVAPAVFNFFKSTFPQTKNFYDEVREGFSRASNQVIDQVVSDQLNTIVKESENSVSQ